MTDDQCEAGTPASAVVDTCRGQQLKGDLLSGCELGRAKKKAPSITDLYKLGWTNFGNAWSVYWNPNANLDSRLFSYGYMMVWGGFHIVGGVGAVLLLRQGAIALITYLATQNPDSTTTMLGRYSDAMDNYMVQARQMGATYFNLGRAYNILDAIGLAKPSNQQFIANQIAKANDFIVYGDEAPGTNLATETSQIWNSNLYTELGDLGNNIYTNFFTAHH